MINIAIAGINGRMGKSLYKAINNTDFNMQLSVATSMIGDSIIGKTVGEVFGDDCNILITDSLSDNFDVLVDFTSVKSTLEHIDFCCSNNKSIVIGTTGFNVEEVKEIKDKSNIIPIFMSSNMSIGVNIMQQLVSTAAKVLHDSADIEIIETHHKHKIDAPSGTAIMIGESIAKAIGVSLSDTGVFTRKGIIGEREKGSIGFSTIRGGDVVGEHTAYYYMEGERIEITHRATDRQIFARGALFAANYLVKKDNGLYNMFNALELGC